MSPEKWEGWADQRALDTSSNAPPAPRAVAFPMWNWPFPAKRGTSRHCEGTFPLWKHHHNQERANTKHWLKEMTPQKFLGPAGQGRWSRAAQHWWNHTWSTTSSSGLQSTRLIWIYWSKSKDGLWKLRDERFLCTMRGWGCWNCFVWRTEAGEDPTPVNTGWEGVKKTQVNSSWWCPGKGQEEWEQI